MHRHLAAEAAADHLRDEILAGRHAPGEHLDEVGLAARLEVSRNTLREAFRLLAHERLVVHEVHRGVFVRRVDAAAARAAYDARRYLECGALHDALARRGDDPDAWAARLDALAAPVAAGHRAAATGDWLAVGTANADFHLALVALAGNPVVTRLVRPLITEMRLRFLLLDDPRGVHEPFLAENDRLVALIRAGDAGAPAVLADYLRRAERVHAAGDD